jgi:hypothetical protein
MFLLFLTPIKDSENLFFECIPARSLIHFSLFWGFVHIWVIACKKQLKNELFRRRAFTFTFLAAVVLALLSELVMYLAGVSTLFSNWNLIFDLVGSGLGILTFRVLYSSCY